MSSSVPKFTPLVEAVPSSVDAAVAERVRVRSGSSPLIEDTADGEAMQVIVARRIHNIKEAHANNLIEGLDGGKEALQAMLERAL